MPSNNQKPLKFRPERPIFLNEENIGVKTKDQVILAIEQLRSLGWLASYNEAMRPFHMSFSSEKMLAEFKRDCKDLGIKLKSPLIKPDDFENLQALDNAIPAIPGAEEENSSDPIAENIHIE